jgi:hypothetical protein
MTQAFVPAAERTCAEAVAYDLMRDIMLDDPLRPPPTSPDFRSYLLDLYMECILAVRAKRTIAKVKPPVRNVGAASEADKREAHPASKPVN